MVVANTLLPGPDHEKAAYHELHARPMQPVTASSFAMLDLLLMPCDCQERLFSIASDRSAAIASHHFPVVADIGVQVPPRARKERVRNIDWASLDDPKYRNPFVAKVAKAVPTCPDTHIGAQWQDMKEVILQVANESLPKQSTVERTRGSRRQRSIWSTRKMLQGELVTGNLRNIAESLCIDLLARIAPAGWKILPEVAAGHNANRAKD